MRTDGNCAVKSWGMAAVLGLLAFLLLMGQGLGTALFLGVLAFVLLGLLFNWLFCAPLPEARPATTTATVTTAAPAPSAKAEPTAGTATTTGVAAAGAAGTEDQAAAETSSEAAAGSGPEAVTETADEAGATADAAVDTAGDDTPPAADAADATDAATPKATEPAGVAGQVGSQVKPSTPLAGEAELASRKGSWTYSPDRSATGGADTAAAGSEGSAMAEATAPDANTDAGTTATAEAKASSPAVTEAKAVSSDAATPASDAPASTSTDSDTARGGGEAGIKVKPSTALAGEAELASRKGGWTYSKDGPAAGAATGAAPADSTEPASDATADFDGDGSLEGTGEGEKPALLDGPREGGADNLKEIKGIGPKLERLCHSLGVYHFDQIAGWSDQEVAWVNANLGGFKGRVTRDNWVEQAKILASGGETEFSQRVEKGGVYD
ncbi:hypothetical protein [Sagittula sp. S175]|uniref:hypothetical protein n=1 Tax=Sagittula sp. S175 TaxID=3415129 RepID=UPI003C7A3FA9